MAKRTRERLLEQAEILFSAKGFYGTSINDVAVTVEVSKQGLLHHFPSKEKLYAAVLENAAKGLSVIIRQARSSGKNPREQLSSILRAMSEPEEKTLRIVILLMRELLDNRERAETAHKWFLRPFLDELVDIVTEGQSQGEFRDVPPLPFIYQLLGATQYYLVSLPTLKQLYSEEEFTDFRRQHSELIDRLLEG